MIKLLKVRNVMSKLRLTGSKTVKDKKCYVIKQLNKGTIEGFKNDKTVKDKTCLVTKQLEKALINGFKKYKTVKDKKYYHVTKTVEESSKMIKEVYCYVTKQLNKH